MSYLFLSIDNDDYIYALNLTKSILKDTLFQLNQKKKVNLKKQSAVSREPQASVKAFFTESNKMFDEYLELIKRK